MSNKKMLSTKGYAYERSGSYKPVDAKTVNAHAERMRKDVIPTLKTQAERKEAGAQRLRLKGLL